MKLRRAKIVNFRSIKSIEIAFEPSCRVLVGINESGKTNIIRALALLDPTREVVAEDLRDTPRGEPLGQDAFVRFVFALDANEVAALAESLSSKLLTDKPGMIVCTLDGRQLTLKQLCMQRNEVLYDVNIRNKSRKWQYWRMPQDMTVPAHLMVPKRTVKSAVVELPDGRKVDVAKYKFIDIRGIESSLVGQVEAATADDLSSAVGHELIQIASAANPVGTYWTYEEANLLPGKINTSQFSANPNMCLPLKSMFELAGVVPIAEHLAQAKGRSNGMRNLLHRVAEEATSHFRTVWREYKDVRFDLAENGPNIEAAIEDVQNTYDMSRRSDGFKRFMSFLLLVSARERADAMTDVLYLHDEPEVSLHPSGARYMRDELLRLAQRNVVVYSTHSIFMIDRQLPGRHLIVTKEDEITSVADVDESNVQEEEVIFQALGTSIFEGLKEWNVIFEGWRDKHLFDVATAKWPSGKSDTARRLASVGVCFAHGVTGVGHVTPMIQLARKECVIVSDGDDVARRAQRDYKGHGTWVRYDQLLPGVGVVTGEDFVMQSAWPAALSWARRSWATIPEIDEGALAAQGGRLGVVDSACEKAGIPKEERKKILVAVKDFLFEHLKRSQIESNYYEALADLAKYIAAPK